MNQKLFWSEVFKSNIFLGPIIFWMKFIEDQNSIFTRNVFNQRFFMRYFFDQQVLGIQFFFNQKIFLGLTIFSPKFVLPRKIWPGIFSLKNLPDHKCFFSKTFWIYYCCAHFFYFLCLLCKNRAQISKSAQNSKIWKSGFGLIKLFNGQ